MLLDARFGSFRSGGGFWFGGKRGGMMKGVFWGGGENERVWERMVFFLSCWEFLREDMDSGLVLKLISLQSTYE